MKEIPKMNVNGHISPHPPQKQLNMEDRDYDLEQPAWSLDELKEAAVEQRIQRPRSLAWAILLHAVPPPNADIVRSIESHRNFYNELSAKLSMDPRGAIGDDPLSQNDESVWRQHFCDNELKNLILQDVVRTFPDELYFREKDVQDLMVRVLFYWARSHDVGYRQGMHEILAPLLFELYLDRKLAPNNITDRLRYILSENHLEHDSHMLFSAVMKGLERFYTTGEVVPTACGRLPTARVAHNPNEVVRYLERIKEDYLVPLDPELAAHLTNSNISMELFGIRWLRLLFGREFPRSELAHLWGFLFAEGPALPHLHYLVLAMLLSVRGALLAPDAGVALAALMRPSRASAAHMMALARHLRSPAHHARPPSPCNTDESPESEYGVEVADAEVPADSGSEGVAEGADVARELAALALLRARLPPAARALARALPRPAPHVQQPLDQILQLASLLQCRNHALIDVETALEAGEGGAGGAGEPAGRRLLLPVAARRPRPKPRAKEVPLQLFHQAEAQGAGLPSLDPLRLRTD